MPFGKGSAFRGWVLIVALATLGCDADGPSPGNRLRVPRGYVDRLEIRLDGRVVTFGPFVGYYFAPDDPQDLSRLRFVCFNERRFYTRDLVENALLFTGEARLTTLPDTGGDIPSTGRISPIFFPEAPKAWLDTRPEPAEEWVHFHSGYDARGAVLTGYWLRHVGAAEFTYDMGGRVGAGSPLYHRVSRGPDLGFGRIVEFDRGPS
ncbi:hypothetical protein [Desulfococcus multivorans]|uniref:Uncharacterized protein n=1 Tax=Desulfococcus multivorans DSM 2059 TaxID=1121405 RepID=S7TWU9_DESML|nr:hypothetical protein [Desulfococcus multivorans]AQV00883.1 hypothetical protein B2D07_08940 [Desulfococcus multivorans]EPR41572.1 hypothetical protein dsmv_2005 [Desulfococcus multivorans DSM 2059]SJZ43715.1 hypothetical protein SAMN02745446_00502 [Desulfococcus multivorans DSM 2059]